MRAQSPCLILCTLTFCAVLSADAVGQSTCGAPEHRQFDFWIGEWEVHTASGQYAGHNRIQRVFGDCVLHEQYSTPSGYHGASFNAYDATSNQWMQTWVDSSGLVLKLSGELVGDAMVLAGTTNNPEGGLIEHRITWTPMQDGVVRQHWQSRPIAADAADREASPDWETAFDGRYTRAGQTGTATLESLAWLLGEWRDDTDGLRQTEVWRPAASDFYRGVGQRLSLDDEEILFEESLALTVMDGAIYYAAKVDENSLPVLFKLVESARGRAVFENPQHDHPTRLAYSLDGECTLAVTVSGRSDDDAYTLRLRSMRPSCKSEQPGP